MIIYAVNIHTGGGKVLLDEILLHKALGPVTAAFLDQRYPPILDSQFPIFYSSGKVLGRLNAEIQLHRFIRESQLDPTTQILFFGNIPPFFKPRLKSYLYLQNCFLTRQVPLPQDSIKEKLRNWIESQLLKHFARQIDEIWVQTNWMKKMTLVYLPRISVSLKPLLPTFKQIPQSETLRIYDILYVGSFSLNKRLQFFIQALLVLDQSLSKNIEVLVILDNSEKSLIWPQFNHIHVTTKFKISHFEIFDFYAQSKIFVTTSLYESFCLPLYEAHHYQCEVVAPEAGYTQDIQFPITLFKTHSFEDLALKLAHFLSSKETR